MSCEGTPKSSRHVINHHCGGENTANLTQNEVSCSQSTHTSTLTSLSQSPTKTSSIVQFSTPIQEDAAPSPEKTCRVSQRQSKFLSSGMPDTPPITTKNTHVMGDDDIEDQFDSDNELGAFFDAVEYEQELEYLEDELLFEAAFFHKMILV